MQDIWSDTNYEESNSTTSENVRRYDSNDFLVFIASMKSVHDSDCDNDSDNEFTDEQKIVFLNNLVFYHEKLIKNYLKDHDILEAHKTMIDMLNVERTNLLLKKLDFLNLNIILYLIITMFSLKR